MLQDLQQLQLSQGSLSQYFVFEGLIHPLDGYFSADAAVDGQVDGPFSSLPNYGALEYY